MVFTTRGHPLYSLLTGSHVLPGWISCQTFENITRFASKHIYARNFARLDCLPVRTVMRSRKPWLLSRMHHYAKHNSRRFMTFCHGHSGQGLMVSRKFYDVAQTTHCVYSQRLFAILSGTVYCHSNVQVPSCWSCFPKLTTGDVYYLPRRPCGLG